MSEQLYYVWARNKGYVGNNVLWWGKNHSGYTCHLDMAGQYPEEEARSICEHSDASEKQVFKVQDVQKVATLQVDSQYMYKLDNLLGEDNE